MDLSIVGISGSPVRKGNTDTLLDFMLNYSKNYHSDTHAVYLSKTNFKDCNHCNFCLSKQKEGTYCSINDNMQEVFERVEKADIIILASPVYFMRTSGCMASFIDRLRVFIYGNVTKGRLKNKVGLSAAVGWARHGGIETTHLSHLLAFLTLEMIPVSSQKCVSTLGASVMTGPTTQLAQEDGKKLSLKQDKAGLHSAQKMVDRAVELFNLTHLRLP